MKLRFPPLQYFIAIIFIFPFVFVSESFGQRTSGSPQPDDDVVKITTSLIRLDAVVLGKDRAPVTDLKTEDFQVFQDGKPQQLTSVVYVDPRKSRQSTGKRNKNEVEAPPSGVRTGQGRLITFVLDDGNCLATVEGNFNMREAMKKFVDEQMELNDRVAIYRTKGGSSLLQIYTSSKEVLRKKISKLGLVGTPGCGSSFGPSDTSARQGSPSTPRSPIRPDPATEIYRSQRENQLMGTIGVLSFVVDRLKDSPQRKELFLLSEGLAIDRFSRSRDALRELADKAARASVVVHTFSNKGLTVPGMLTAADDVAAADTDTISAQRIAEEDALNGGLAYLAYTTGGKFVTNRTFLEKDIGKILSADGGYYLISYEPADSTFKGKEFHEIEVKVNRPDLTVISRKGFFGRDDVDAKPVYKSADGELFRAVSSPFLENGIDLRMTIMYGNSPKDGNYIRAMFHIKGEDLPLNSDANESKDLVMDVVAVTLDEKAKVVDEFNRSYTLEIPAGALSMVMRNGIDFSSDMPIKRPGLYTYRVAVRERISKRLGSAGDFIEIPDAKSDKFFISGLAATTFGADGKPILPENRSLKESFAPVQTKASPSVRQFNHGQTLVYAYTVYNAEVRGNAVSLTRQIRLFRDGKMMLDSGEKPIAVLSTAAATRIDDFGTIRISNQVAPGEYALQVIVRDRNSNEVSEQSIDFEVLPSNNP